MTVETDLQEIVDNTEWYLKDIKDLSNDERSKIVKELTVYSLSDSFIALSEECTSNAKQIEVAIREELASLSRNKEPAYSQLEREVATKEFMEEIIDIVDDSIGGKVLKASLSINVKNFDKIIHERIEVGYDTATYSELDMMKHNRLLNLSVKQWLTQTITAYEKTNEAPEEKGAY